MDNPKFASFIRYARGKKVEVLAENPDFGYTMDGEMVSARQFSLEVLPGALRFSIPKAAVAFLEKKTGKEVIKV